MKLAELYTEITVRGLGAAKSGMAALRATARTADRALSAVATSAKAVGAAMTAFTAISVRNAATQQDAIVSLEAALRASGDEALRYSTKLQQLASELQSVTTYGDEALMPIMALGLHMGIGADQIDEATKAAIGLSKAFPIDMAMAMRGVALATQGEFTLLNRYIPALRTAATESDKFAALNRAVAGGLEKAAAETTTLQGSMKQLWDVMGDVTERVGMPLIKSLTAIAQNVRAFLTNNMDTVQSWMTTIGGWLRTAAEFWINTYATIETAIMNWGDVVSGIVGEVGLAFQTLKLDVEYFLTNALPKAFVQFLGALSKMVSAVRDMSGVILDIMIYSLNPKNWLSGANKDFSDQILEATQSAMRKYKEAMSEMPKIAGRETSDAEKAVRAGLDKAWAGLSGKKNQRKKQIMDALGLSDVALPDAPDIAFGGLGGGGGSSASQTTADASRFVGLAAAAKSIQTSLGAKSPAEKAQVQTATNTQEISQSVQELVALVAPYVNASSIGAFGV